MGMNKVGDCRDLYTTLQQPSIKMNKVAVVGWGEGGERRGAGAGFRYRVIYSAILHQPYMGMNKTGCCREAAVVERLNTVQQPSTRMTGTVV